MNKRTAIAEGLQEAQDEAQAASDAYERGRACHCCCCTGECTGSFQDAPEWQQEAWLQNYWEDVLPELFWPWIPARV